MTCIVREIKFLVIGQKIATLRQNFNVKLRELLMFDKKFVIFLSDNINKYFFLLVNIMSLLI
jgi:hypothetical protein